MSSELPSISLPELGAVTLPDPEGLLLRFRGTADMSAQELFGTYLDCVHEVAMKGRAARMIVDFCELDFMNSACFSLLVSFLLRIEELTYEHRYTVLFRPGYHHYWQRKSLHALALLVPEIVMIEGEDGVLSAT